MSSTILTQSETLVDINLEYARLKVEYLKASLAMMEAQVLGLQETKGRLADAKQTEFTLIDYTFKSIKASVSDLMDMPLDDRFEASAKIAAHERIVYLALYKNDLRLQQIARSYLFGPDL